MRKGLLGSALVFLALTSAAIGQTAPSPSTSQATFSVGGGKLGSPELPPLKFVTTTPGITEPTETAAVPEARAAWGASAGRPLQYWVSAEYLLWWTKAGSSPPLVTTGPPLPVTPSPGSFAAPGTVVLFGGDALRNDPFSGGRFTVGFWCNDCQSIGAEATFFFLGQRTGDFGAATTGAPGSGVLARPFFDTSTGTLNSELVGYPGLAAGSIRVQSSTGLLGAEGNMLYNLCRSCDTCCDLCCAPTQRYRVDLLAGFRYMELREGLGIAENTQVLPTAPVFAGDNINAFDQFSTLNRFYGGQVGIRSEVSWGRVFVNATGIVALGDTHQTIDINGSSRITTPGGMVTILPGDLYAQRSNIGHYSRDQFSVIPELDFNIGYQVTRNLRVFVGYSVFYWTNVERPGDAISTAVNSTRVPTSTVAPSGPLSPLFSFRDSNFWAQGVNFGIELRF